MKKLKKHYIIYDGECNLCKRSVNIIKLFSKNFIFDPNNKTDEIIYIENGKVYKGFYAIRRIVLKIPILWIFLIILYFPFFDRIGSKIYKYISKNRKWI